MFDCPLLRTPPPEGYYDTNTKITFPSLYANSPPPSPVTPKYKGTIRHWQREKHTDDLFPCVGGCGHATTGSQFCLKLYCCHPYGSWALVKTEQNDLVGLCKDGVFIENTQSSKQYIPPSGIVRCNDEDHMLFFLASGKVLAMTFPH